MRTISQAYHDDYLHHRDDRYDRWAEAYRKVVERVQSADHDTWTTPEFQRFLWEDDSISTLGPGNAVTIEAAYTDRELAERLWELRHWNRPEDVSSRAKFLQDAFEEILRWVSPRYNARRPSARLARLFCALFPRDTVCLLAHYMTGWVRRAFRMQKAGWELIGQQVVFRDRMRAELGPERDIADDVQRSQFAWYILEQVRPSEETESEEASDDIPTSADSGEQAASRPKTSSARLPIRILPVDVQSKGLSYVGQSLSVILGALRSAEHGATREDIVRQIMTDAPGLSRNSAQSTYSTIPRLGLIELRGGALYPTERGLALLDGEAPGEVITPVLISKVFGVAHILNELRNAGGHLQPTELAARLQSYYPNWTTTFAPTSLFHWLQALKLIETQTVNDRRELALTDTGFEWATSVPTDMSAWRVEPTELVSDAATTEELTAEIVKSSADAKAQMQVASLDDVHKNFYKLGLVGLKDELRLVHGALHALPGKRFVLLAGLSGTGKSALSRGYAKAYCEALGLPPERHKLEIAVRPDWIDPGGLLGFFNPIGNPPGFQATNALRLLLDASAHPHQPFFLCLDEMNLARVEHYFAPLLSAMEGARLEIHSEGETIDNVPSSIEWPRNLFILGTVNMDESTQAFSDKVLDRAFVFEFWDVDLEGWRAKRASENNDATLVRVFNVIKPIYDALYAGGDTSAIELSRRCSRFVVMDAIKHPILRQQQRPSIKQSSLRC